jgi:hypothetical protein
MPVALRERSRHHDVLSPLPGPRHRPRQLTVTLTPPTDPRTTPDGEFYLDSARPEVSSDGPIEAVEASAATPDPQAATPPEVPAAADGSARGGRRGSRAAPAAAAQQRQRGFPRAERPATVPAPQHHHLPGWVRRDFAKARPALADLLGLLQGDERARFQQRVDELTAGITSGKFSLAWQYPTLIEDGRKIYEAQRSQIAESQRVQRQLESARRRAGDRLRDAGELLAPDAAARLSRSLRQATDLAAIAEIEAEADRALSSARSAGSRRRDREIERTRNRLLRTLPKAALIEEPQTESWQDVLRRFAMEQSGEQDADQRPEPQQAGAGTSD